MQTQKHNVPRFNTPLCQPRKKAIQQVANLHSVYPVENPDTTHGIVAVKQNYTAHTATSQDTLKRYASRRIDKQVPKRHQRLRDLAHSRLSGCKDTNIQGKLVEDFILKNNLCLLNTGVDTCLHPGKGF